MIEKQSFSDYIVDCDQPILAPKKRDLMFIDGGIATVWHNPYELDYQSMSGSFLDYGFFSIFS